MNGVKIVARWAFYYCLDLTYLECCELERIEDEAFQDCSSLRCIDLSSVRVVKEGAFDACVALTDVIFGSKLERIEVRAFCSCFCLERITIPLKDGMITDDRIFQDCEKLRHVDLVEGELHETVAALQLEEWKTDLNEEIDAINQILPNAYAGSWENGYAGGKAIAIRTWIRSVLRKIIRYQEEHHRLLYEAGSIIQHALPRDIVMKVLPFLELPSYTFEVENDEDVNDEDEMEEDDLVL